MSQLLAVNWDEREVRIVLATAGGDSLQVRAADSILLDEVSRHEREKSDAAKESADTETEETVSETSAEELAGLAISELLARHKISRRVTTLAAVNRGSVELINFDVPPVEEEELPELVGNLALREAQHLTDQSVLDFSLVGNDPTSPRHVTAAVLSGVELAKINTTLDTSGLKASRLLLRPYATASLFAQTASPPERTVLLVSRVGNEIDLIVLVDLQVVFFRSFRVSEGSAEHAEEEMVSRLVAEINRTLAVSLVHTGQAGPVQAIYLFGSAAREEKLADALKTRMDLSVLVLDPFGPAVVVEGPLPDESGDFAPLLGMLLDEAASRRHAIDFLHPRKQPPPPNRKRLWTILGSVLGVVLLVGGWHVWGQLANVDEINEGLSRKAQELQELVKQASKKETVVKAIQEWQLTEVNWLDELHDMSLRLPTSRDAVLLKMTLAPGRSGGGLISFYGLVRDPAIILSMENNVRDEFHDIRSKQVREQQTEKDYTWRFETSISILKRSKERYAKDFESWTAQIAQQQELDRQEAERENKRPETTEPKPESNELYTPQ